MERVWQEFYCRDGNGGCGGYMMVKLSLAMNRVILVKCPKCGHEHQRSVINGVISLEGRDNATPAETFTPLLSAWTETPTTQAMIDLREKKGKSLWDAAKLGTEADAKKSREEKEARAILDESLFERYASKLKKVLTRT